MSDRTKTGQFGEGRSNGIFRRAFMAGAAGLATGGGGAPGLAANEANPQTPSRRNRSPVKIVIIGDLTGSTSDWAGQGSIEAARLAIEDVGSTVLGVPIELISVDHQNKPDNASAQARELFDVQNVGMVLNLSNSRV